MGARVIARAATTFAATTIVAVVAACGARTGLDVLAVDATAPLDAGESPVLGCTGGYFLAVTDGARTTVLRGGCKAAEVPSGTCVMRAANCLDTAIEACDGVDSALLDINNCLGGAPCDPLAVGDWPVTARLNIGGAASYGPATLFIKAVSPTAASGDFRATLMPYDGGGPFTHVIGSFCVRP